MPEEIGKWKKDALPRGQNCTTKQSVKNILVQQNTIQPNYKNTTMIVPSFALLLVAYACSPAPVSADGAGVVTEPLAADVLDASATIQVDADTCAYVMTIMFKPSESYPLPAGPECKFQIC